MDTTRKDILIEGPEVAGLLGSPNEKQTSFSRTESFSSKIVQKDNSGERTSFLNESIDCADGEKSSSEDVKTVGTSGKAGPKQFTGWKRYLGMGLAIFSSAVFSLTVIIIKAMDEYEVSSRAFWRFQGILIPSVPLLLLGLCGKNKRNVFEPIHPICQKDKLKNFMYLFLRAFFGCGAVLLHYTALQYMDVADSTVIVFSTPVFVTFIAHFLLGEDIGIINVFSAVLTLIGVTVIVRPPFLTGAEHFDDKLLLGAGLALGSMVFASSVFLVLRILRGVHYSLTTFFFGLYGSIECLILAAIVGTMELPVGSWDWFMAIVLAALTYIGQVATTLALQYEEAGPIALCRTCDVIFSFIWQFAFLGIVPDLFSFGGSMIVMTGVLLVSFRKYVSMLPEKNQFRQKFWFVLK